MSLLAPTVDNMKPKDPRIRALTSCTGDVILSLSTCPIASRAQLSIVFSVKSIKIRLKALKNERLDMYHSDCNYLKLQKSSSG